MIDQLLLPLGLLAGTLLGGAVIWLFLRHQFSRLTKEQQLNIATIEQYKKEVEQLRTDNHDTELRLAASDAELRFKREQIEQQARSNVEMKEQIEQQFRLVASQIMEEKSRQLNEANKEGIGHLLKPLSDRLGEFHKTVLEVYDKEGKERFSLGERIKELVDLNQRISLEANNLAKALKGESKIQGDWGEMILESILEKSGLKRNEEYFVQETIKDDAGRAITGHEGRTMRPDVRIKYPDDREIVIDSKVSLLHYTQYISAVDAEEAAIHLAHHLQSVRRHIDELSQKNYQDFVSSLDFVMMFVPNEAAYMIAMQTDSALWQYAYGKKIIIISPTHLITALKLVYDLWKREYQNRHAIDIADRGALIYDKLVGFVETLTELGSNIDKTQKSYDRAFNQLKSGNGNLINQAQKLHDLGIKARKSLPKSLSNDEKAEE